MVLHWSLPEQYSLKYTARKLVECSAVAILLSTSIDPLYHVMSPYAPSFAVSTNLSTSSLPSSTEKILLSTTKTRGKLQKRGHTKIVTGSFDLPQVKWDKIHGAIIRNKISPIFITPKRSLGKGNVFTGRRVLVILFAGRGGGLCPGGLPDRDPQTETPWTENPPGQRPSLDRKPPWTETPLTW